jgi:hypothetical protein
MTTSTPFYAGIALFLAAAHSLSAATLVSDSFELPDHPTGDRTIVTGGGSGIKFYTRNATGPNYSVNIVNDTGVGGLGSKAIQQNDTIGGYNQIIGLLPQTVSLAVPGDYIQLTFKFRFTNGSTAFSRADGFRFGIFSSNGTVITADGTATAGASEPISDNDIGYYAQAGVRSDPATNNMLWHETGGSNPILGGADRANLLTSAVGGNFGDNVVHTASLTLTRNVGNKMSLSLSYDGGGAITATDSLTSPLPVFAFDEVGFGNAVGTTSLIFNIDDVSVITNVPEPASGCLLAIATAALLGLRRRRTRVVEG